MSDIWSGIGVDISKSDGEFLYRQGGEVRGPVPIKVLADKLKRGELPLDTQVAIEGGDFHPVAQVAAFADAVKEAKKLLAKRAAARVRRIVAVVVMLLGALGAAGYYFVSRELERRAAERQAQLKVAEQERARREAERQKLGKPELVALVSLGSEEEVKIKSEHHKVPPPRKGQRPTGASKPVEEKAITECERSQGEILGVLGKHLAKINVCVVDEKSRDTQGLLPSTLPIDFVVRPDGKVVDFSIGHRAYKKGPLNNCMLKVFNSVHYPGAAGSNCPVSLPLKIGK